MKTEDGYNLCRSANDRRPLLDRWFSEFGYDRKTGTIPCLKYVDEEAMQTVAYPINPDGTLNTEKVIIENRRYGKVRIV